MVGVFQLMVQTVLDFLPALFVDLGFEILPDGDEVLYLFDATSVAVVHFFEDRAATLETICPGYAVEPEKVALRACVDVIVDGAIGFAILCSGV